MHIYKSLDENQLVTTLQLHGQLMRIVNHKSTSRILEYDFSLSFGFFQMKDSF